MFKTIHTIDETLDLTQSRHYNMSILFSKDGLSFCIVDNRTQKAIAYQTIPIDSHLNIRETCFFLSKTFKNCDWFNYSFKDIKVVFQWYKSTIIPQNLYVDLQSSQFLELNFGALNEEETLSNKLPFLDAQNVFAVPKCVLDTFRTFLPIAQILHSNTPFLNGLFKAKHKSIVALQIGSNYFDMIVLESNKLQLSNSFFYKSNEDFLYFLVYTLEQLKLEPKNIVLQLNGHISADSELFQLLRKYFLNLTFAEKPTALHYSYVFSKIESQYISTHLNSFLCE